MATASSRMKGKPPLKKGGTAAPPAAQVGVPRYHAAFNGKGEPVMAGFVSKTSIPKIPKPIVGAGKGFRGI